MLIGTAWELPDFRIVGGNKELMNTKYHITAKASGGATLGLKQMLPLLKNLIVERFQLKFHVEPREMSHYDLVLARSDGRLGPELKPSKSDCSNEDELNAQRGDAALMGNLGALVPKPGEFLSCTIAPNLAGGPTNLSLHGDGQELKVLADVLSQFTGKYVRDKTGLTGRYDFDMKLDMQALLATRPEDGYQRAGRRAAAVGWLVGDDRAQRTARAEARVDPWSGRRAGHRQRRGAGAGLSRSYCCLSKIRVFVNVRPWPVFPLSTCVIVLPSAETETVIVVVFSKASSSVYRSTAFTVTIRIDSTPSAASGYALPSRL